MYNHRNINSKEILFCERRYKINPHQHNPDQTGYKQNPSRLHNLQLYPIKDTNKTQIPTLPKVHLRLHGRFSRRRNSLLNHIQPAEYQYRKFPTRDCRRKLFLIFKNPLILDFYHCFKKNPRQRVNIRIFLHSQECKIGKEKEGNRPQFVSVHSKNVQLLVLPRNLEPKKLEEFVGNRVKSSFKVDSFIQAKK